jgi:hypothetical protein
MKFPKQAMGELPRYGLATVLPLMQINNRPSIGRCQADRREN